jgi:hypothetical protein
MGGTWNPAKPLGLDNRIFGPALATYSLDESGIVHLRLQPKKGPEQVLSGSIPEGLLHDTPAARRNRTLKRWVLAIYGTWIGVGFALGFLLSGGSTGRRLEVGALGLLAAIVVAPLAELIPFVGWSVRLLLRREEPVQEHLRNLGEDSV